MMRRLAVAQLLLPANFDLGFRALHAFGGARVARTYAAAAGSLARAGEAAALRGMLQRIQGTVTDEEWDEVWHAACMCPRCNLYLPHHATLPTSPALLTCGERRIARSWE
jgi:hypothetical protein